MHTFEIRVTAEQIGNVEPGLLIKQAVVLDDLDVVVGVGTLDLEGGDDIPRRQVMDIDRRRNHADHDPFLKTLGVDSGSDHWMSEFEPHFSRYRL
ncbi:hypothetical protein GOB57_23855 [Sinorhizobium meliloti]|nr:hypothetical protein [Sinorhizobium meliloti]